MSTAKSINPPTPVVLSDPYIDQLISNPGVRSSFPKLAEFARSAAKQAAANCTTCGGSQSKLGAEFYQQVRGFILSMGQPELDRLRGLLGIPGRQFMSYMPAAGGVSRPIWR